jgi:hypothetical protein
VANRRFELYEYRQVIVQMRLGQSDRQIAKCGLMGRAKARVLRALAPRTNRSAKGREWSSPHYGGEGVWFLPIVLGRSREHKKRSGMGRDKTHC